MAESGPQKASEPDPDASRHSETAEEENPAIAAFNSWGGEGSPPPPGFAPWPYILLPCQGCFFARALQSLMMYSRLYTSRSGPACLHSYTSSSVFFVWPGQFVVFFFLMLSAPPHGSEAPAMRGAA